MEKHVTFDKNAEGPDHKASSTVQEFAELVQSIRKVEKMMGSREKIFSDQELEIKRSVRKSIVSTRDLEEGHILSDDDICYKRPGFGIKPTDKNLILGKKTVKAINANKVILPEFLSDE